MLRRSRNPSEPQPLSVEREELHPLVYPDHYSVRQQSDARDKLRALLSDTEADLDRKRRERDLGPEQNVTSGTDNEIVPETVDLTTVSDEKLRALVQAGLGEQSVRWKARKVR
jgi:hypothetical protein